MRNNLLRVSTSPPSSRMQYTISRISLLTMVLAVTSLSIPAQDGVMDGWDSETEGVLLPQSWTDGLDNDLDGLVDELFDLDDDGSFTDPADSGVLADDGCVGFYGLTGIDCDDSDSALNASDLDGDGVANDCDIDQTNGPDYDGNGIDDSCDPDENGNGIPDACDLFRRGDVNTDGSVNIADPIALINYVLGLYETTCVDAADVNDNGNVNIVDIVHLLLMIMDGTPQVPAPGIINCGPDPTADALDCVSYDGC